MRIRSVTAHAFGPLVGRTMEFADGMTVVVGDNESAKSSWHAAIFAALCGRRRGRGRPHLDEQRFIDLHKPWDRDDWRVTARVVLDDGRRVEMQQDLVGKVDCQAKDLDLGLDISAEVMNEGTPDAARWLGLDRSSFVATACVEQAQMLRVQAEAGGLQTHLQRAAATAGTDSTAAAALGRLEAFGREHVGLDRANSTKPLHRATVAHEKARAELDAARHDHDDYLKRVENVDHLRSCAAQATAQVQAHEAAAAAHHASQLGGRASRAEHLHAVYGNTTPASVADDDALVRDVDEALLAWKSRPDEPIPPDRTSTELLHELENLPETPTGDLEMHASVQQAVELLQRTEAQRESHDQSRPSDATEAVPPIAASDDELLDMARTLDAPDPEVDPALVNAEQTATADVTKTRTRTRQASALLIAGPVAAVIGLLLLTAAHSLFGLGLDLGLVAAGAALLAFGAALRRGRRRAIEHNNERAMQLRIAREYVDATRGIRARALQRCSEIGVPPDPAALRRVPAVRARAAAHEREVRRWSDRRTQLDSEVTSAKDALAAALTTRGQAAPGDTGLIEAASRYREECRQRAAQAAAAARRIDLAAQREACLSAEARAEMDRAARASAAQLITDAATTCEITADSTDAAAAGLATWVQQRAGHLNETAREQQEWAELQALLDGRSLDQLQDEAAAAEHRAQTLAEQADTQLLGTIEAATAAEQLPSLQQADNAAQRSAAAAEGELRQFANSLHSVAEAEEALEAARAELDRVQTMQETLELTRRFLAAAQSRAHRDIAPTLAATVRQWLPQVTGGRYIDVTVNPETLQVDVCGASRRWWQADRLSFGTAEQVYLLLRIALADHLTKNHDTCPLILDDVTVHADATRTRDILNLLLTVAEDRQIILFTQEEQVASWATECLGAPHNALVRLDEVAVP